MMGESMEVAQPVQILLNELEQEWCAPQLGSSTQPGAN